MPIVPLATTDRAITNTLVASTGPAALATIATPPDALHSVCLYAYSLSAVSPATFTFVDSTGALSGILGTFHINGPPNPLGHLTARPGQPLMILVAGASGSVAGHASTFLDPP